MQAATEQRSRMQPQPLEVLNVPGAMLNIRTVEAVVGYKKTKINEEIKAGKFPAPIRESPTCSRWVSDQIRAYLDCRRKGIAWPPQGHTQ